MAGRKGYSTIPVFFFFGLSNSVAFFLWDYVRYRFLSENIYSYLFEGFGIALCALAGDYLLRSVVRPAITGIRSPWQFLIHLPLWFMAGGIGYEIGFLTAKKIGLLSLYERPIRSVFIFGVCAGAALQACLHILRTVNTRVAGKH